MTQMRYWGRYPFFNWYFIYPKIKIKKARIFLNNDFSLCRQLQLTHNLKVFFYLQKKTIFAQVKNMNLHKATYFHTLAGFGIGKTIGSQAGAATSLISSQVPK
jgi:hypothetical protein